MLDVAAAVATGRPILGQPNDSGPLSVLYLDWEMTEGDLAERLQDLGYGPDTDLSHFHYVFRPFTEPLDTQRSGEKLLAATSHCGAELVVLDTFGRAVQGEENNADTVRDFYRYTGQLLKTQGIACLGLDHAGKEPGKGARGSSAKGDDVNVIWDATPTQDGLRLKSTARMSWIPAELNITRNQSGPLAHTITTSDSAYVEGTKELAELLDELEIPTDWGRPKVVAALKKHGTPRRAAAVGDAIRWRKAAIPKYP